MFAVSRFSRSNQGSKPATTRLVPSRATTIAPGPNGAISCPRRTARLLIVFGHLAPAGLPRVRREHSVKRPLQGRRREGGHARGFHVRVELLVVAPEPLEMRPVARLGRAVHCRY